MLPREQRSVTELSSQQPFTFLYVSILMPYKHQIQVARAVDTLRRSGCPVKIRFVGADWGGYGQRFREVLRQLDPQGEFLLWAGEVPFTQLHADYESADAFIFASSCENLPNILIEAMAAALPIACSDRGPMPEVLGDAGIYFNPEQPNAIAGALRALVDNVALREQLAGLAKNRSQAYSWQRCARETFDFIAAVAVQCGAKPA
jgi:glycosyltransferase involved in cell wall biosynthesis